MAFTVHVNGVARTVDVEPDMPLLWVLRDELEMKGTKFGCGAALCGACTVHINGAPVRSCIMPISAVGNANVTTIEGMATNPVGRRLQEVWQALDVPQCGYCQAG
jgi:isoquinoline 1-oxidoreductase subunit alpha